MTARAGAPAPTTAPKTRPEKRKKATEPRSVGLASRLAAVGLTVAALGLSSSSLADEARAVARGPAPPSAEPAPLEVRVATSKAAHKRLGSQRVRRLLAIELEDEAQVASTPNGSLAGDIIRIWIDVPSSRRALIEVRRGARSVARRTLAISGFPADVAARVVAIATSEMVRVQARVQPRPTPSGDRSGQAGEGAGEASFAVGGSLSALILPASNPAWSFGPELSLAHQIGVTSQALYGRWQLGDGDDGHVRWLEIGALAGVRLPLSPQWRLRLAAKAGGVSLALPQAASDEARSDWTVHAGGQLGIEVALAPRNWLGFSVEPGALLRTVGAEDPSGQRSEVGGFALGLGLGLVAAP